MMEQTNTSGTPFSIKWFLQSLEEATGRDYSPELERFILRGEFISMPDWQLVTSKMTLESVNLFYLGFSLDRKTIARNAKIANVEPGSNAEKAGLLPGDVLAGFSTTYKPSEPTSILVIRSGEKWRISYFASREIQVPQLH